MEYQTYTNDNKEQTIIVIDKKYDRLYYINRYLSIVLKYLAIILSTALIIGSLSLSYHLSNKKTKNFVFSKGSDFKSVKYYGKSEIFESVLNRMLKIIDYSETKSDSELSDFIGSSARNFLFYGPPGTGKTQFVKKLTYLLNLKLNKKYKIKDKDSVRAYLITPSDINDKYVGETERKIRTLFKEAREDKKYKATIIFIDEIDAFFGNRSTLSNEYANRSKTEFLNLLSGINEDLRKNVFFMGATNRTKDIDPAFKRRLGRSLEFFLPEKKEILVMLNEITADWLPKEEIINFDPIADIFKKRESSQSLISDICKELIAQYGKNHKNLRSVLVDLVLERDKYLEKRKFAENIEEYIEHEEITEKGNFKFNIGHFNLI